MAEDEEFPAVGNTLDVVIKIPPLVGAKPSFINGHGKIIRTEQRPCDETAIAVEILDFDIQNEPGCWFRKLGDRDLEPSAI